MKRRYGNNASRGSTSISDPDREDMRHSEEAVQDMLDRSIAGMAVAAAGRAASDSFVDRNLEEEDEM